MKTVVFVVQQADLRSREEVAAVVGHLEQTAREKLGDSAADFRGLGKDALIAKTMEGGEQLLEDSNFCELESYIDTAVTHGEARLGKLRSVCNSGQIALRDLTEKARKRF